MEKVQADKEPLCSEFKVHVNNKIVSLKNKHLASYKYSHGNRNANAPYVNLPIHGFEGKLSLYSSMILFSLTIQAWVFEDFRQRLVLCCPWKLFQGRHPVTLRSLNCCESGKKRCSIHWQFSDIPNSILGTGLWDCCSHLLPVTATGWDHRA